MRLVSRLFALAAMSAAVAIAAVAQASAWDHDRVYADSFGNLVVESAAGYKRIIVGEGKHAKELADFTRSHEPRVVTYDDANTVVTDCYRPPALVKGRSYMYGFDEGEIPFQGGDCR